MLTSPDLYAQYLLDRHRDQLRMAEQASRHGPVPARGRRRRWRGRSTVVAAAAAAAATVVAATVLATAPAVAAPAARPPTAAVAPASSAAAQAIRPVVERMLAGWNSGDYADWSASWSKAMKAGVPAGAFDDLRRAHYDVVGPFRSLLSLTRAAADAPGFVQWTARARFANGVFDLAVVTRPGSTVVEGVHLGRAG